MTKVVSFRGQLKGTVSDFLEREGIECAKTASCLVELVVSLSDYREEGVILFPTVILCQDLVLVLTLLQCTNPIKVGEGRLKINTVQSALKKCAPLAHNRWVIYIEKKESDEIEYGVFRIPTSPSAQNIRETIISLSQEDDNPGFQAILLSQIAERAVELVGVNSGSLNLYLSATPDDAPHPQSTLASIVEVCCENVEPNYKEQVYSFLWRTLHDGIRECHGTLIAVIKSDECDIQKISSDGIFFELPHNLAQFVQDYENESSDISLATLMDFAELLRGMLNTDGIILMTNEAKIVGYNMFVKESPHQSESIEINGGARMRAYEILRTHVQEGNLLACFIRSSDGASDVCLGECHG